MTDLTTRLEALNKELPQLYADYKHNKRVEFLNKLLGLFTATIVLVALYGNISLVFDRHYVIFAVNLLLVIVVLLIYDLEPKDNFFSNILQVQKVDIACGMNSVIDRINYINEMNFLYQNGRLSEENLDDTRYQIASSIDSITKLKKYN